MNFTFLPDKIKKVLESTIPGKVPASIICSSANLEGEPGEGYVIVYDDKVFLFSRKLGENNYLTLSGNYDNDIASIKTRKDKNNAFLDIDIAGKTFSIKFLTFEEKEVASLLKKWQSGKGVKNGAFKQTAGINAESVETSEKKDSYKTGSKATLSPAIGMCAALMYLSNVDSGIAKEEDTYITAVFSHDQSILQPALHYFKTHSFEELLNALSIININNEQKLCILANILELGMRDGILHTCEQKMILRFVKAMNISEDEYQSIKQVLLIKNRISVLEECQGTSVE